MDRISAPPNLRIVGWSLSRVVYKRDFMLPSQPCEQSFHLIVYKAFSGYRSCSHSTLTFFAWSRRQSLSIGNRNASVCRFGRRRDNVRGLSPPERESIRKITLPPDDDRARVHRHRAGATNLPDNGSETPGNVAKVNSTSGQEIEVRPRVVISCDSRSPSQSASHSGPN